LTVTAVAITTAWTAPAAKTSPSLGGQRRSLTGWL
jgi:hypothetical protein